MAEKSALSPEQVCAIIKACGESQVRVLKFAGLYVEFERTPLTPVVAEEVLPPPATEMAESQLKIEEGRGILQRELQIRDDQVAQMMIENPVLAEQLLMDGDLADDDDTDAEEA